MIEFEENSWGGFRDIVIGIILFCLMNSALAKSSGSAYASKPPPTPTSNPLESIKIKVDGDKGGLLTIPQNSLPEPPPRFLLMVRLEKDSFEILGRGQIVGIQDNKYLIELDRESMLKHPGEGDYAVPMAPPKNFPKLPELLISNSGVSTEDPELPTEQGYAQLDVGSLRNSSYVSQGFLGTNEYKDIPTFNPSTLHFLWYFDFLWHFGVEWNRVTGNFLTNSYDRRQFGSSMSESKISLHYRFRRFFYNKLRWTVKINSFNNTFSTENNDDYLLSSNTSGTGLGLRFGWEFKEPQWSTESYQPFAIQQIVYDYDLYSNLNVVDLNYIRGKNSNGSSLVQQQLTLSILAYLKWMPFFKRYVIDISAGQSRAQIQFHGPSSAPTGSLNTIAEEGIYSENYDFVKIAFGLRMDDLLGRFFKPR